MLCDLDHFKSINDEHGHAAGDFVLKQTVAACQMHLRASDIFGRFGGEEFGDRAARLQPRGCASARRAAAPRDRSHFRQLRGRRAQQCRRASASPPSAIDGLRTAAVARATRTLRSIGPSTPAAIASCSTKRRRREVRTRRVGDARKRVRQRRAGERDVVRARQRSTDCWLVAAASWRRRSRPIAVPR